MKLELKNIKHSEFASEETHCYQATLYVDGKKMAEVKNDGQGGSDYQWALKPFTEKDLDKVRDWCIKNLPKWTSENDKKKEENDTDLEMWCGEEVNKFLVSRDLKRKLNKKIIYEQNKELWEYSFKGVKKLEQKHLISFVNGVAKAKVENNENWKNVTAILNTLPFDKALEIYRKH
jgi:hypothetical protein